MLLNVLLLLFLTPIYSLLCGFGRIVSRNPQVLCMSVDGTINRRDNSTLAYTEEDLRLKVPKEFSKVNIPNGVDISMSAVEVKKINDKVQIQSESGMSDLDMLKKAIEDMLNQM